MPHYTYICLKVICVGNLCGQPSCNKLHLVAWSWHVFPIIYDSIYEYNVSIAIDATCLMQLRV
jgi:hypothetical protein